MMDDPRDVPCKRANNHEPHTEHSRQDGDWCPGFWSPGAPTLEQRVAKLEQRVAKLEQRIDRQREL